MKSFFRKFAVTAVSLSGAVLFVTSAQACGGGGGGGFGGGFGGGGFGGYRGYGHSRPVYSQPSSYAPQQAYARQQYPYGQQYPSQVQQPPPIVKRPQPQAPVQPQFAQPSQAAPPQQQFARRAPGSQQPLNPPAQQVRRQTVARPQSPPQQFVQGGGEQGGPSAESGLNALAGAPAASGPSRPTTRRALQAQPVAPGNRHVARTAPPPRSQPIAAPNNQPAPQSQPQAPQQDPIASQPQLDGGELSALQALSSFDEPAGDSAAPSEGDLGAQQADFGEPSTETSVQPQSAGPDYVGSWTASLPNGARVQLVLSAEGTFNWIATNNGKTSNFDGTYTLENGSLVLVRSSDNQKLSGSFTPIDDGYNFKLAGGKDKGLNFARG